MPQSKRYACTPLPSQDTTPSCHSQIPILQVDHCRNVGLQTLSVMAEDMDDEHLPVVAKAMLPVVVQGISQSALPANQIQLALSILTSCVKGMAIMNTVARKALRRELKATGDLIPALCSVISKDLSASDTR